MKLTKQKIAELAQEIKDFLMENDLAVDTSIYYNDKVERYRWSENGHFWETQDDIDPHNYFEYAAHDHILSMSFEGALYSSLNRTGYKEEEFMAIFDKYGVYYELGNAWNLTCYTIDDDTEVEYTVYKQPKETIRLYRADMDMPTELKVIMSAWYELSSLVGDIGSCVLGAGFEFEYKGNKYFMTAQSPYQGSISWETPKDKIKEMLVEIGATNITYEWGNMD